MAVRGSILKSEIANQILQALPNSFLYNDGKEIRVNGEEDGVPVQIKIALTAAKVAVEPDGAATAAITPATAATAAPTTTNVKVPQEPSEEEKNRLSALLEQLGL